MKNKNGLGQFFTTNSKYIIGNLFRYFPIKKLTIIDPFVGNYDLLDILPNYIETIGYDIDPKQNHTIKQDTLTNPPSYNDKWIITNPPYLAKNNAKTNTLESKKTNSDLYEKFKLNDLYKIAIKTIMNCNGGIIIVPLNFFCEEKSSIRNEFLSNFKILALNIFEEDVFDDTSYTVCSFFFERSENKLSEQNIQANIFPNQNKMMVNINQASNFRFAHEFHSLINVKSKIKISRLLKDQTPNSNLKLRALDSGSSDGRIKLTVDDFYFDDTKNKSERSFCTLVFNKNFSITEQEIIANEFNLTLEKYRKKYNSLFLTNFRNSTSSYARKRIGFETAYQLVTYVISILGI